MFGSALFTEFSVGMSSIMEYSTYFTRIFIFIIISCIRSYANCCMQLFSSHYWLDKKVQKTIIVTFSALNTLSRKIELIFVYLLQCTLGCRLWEKALDSSCKSVCVSSSDVQECRTLEKLFSWIWWIKLWEIL